MFYVNDIICIHFIYEKFSVSKSEILNFSIFYKDWQSCNRYINDGFAKNPRQKDVVLKIE